MGVPDRFPNPQLMGDLAVSKEHYSDWYTVKYGELYQSVGLFQRFGLVVFHTNLHERQSRKLVDYFQTIANSLNNQEWGGHCECQDPNGDHNHHHAGGFLQVPHL